MSGTWWRLRIKGEGAGGVEEFGEGKKKEGLRSSQKKDLRPARKRRGVLSRLGVEVSRGLGQIMMLGSSLFYPLVIHDSWDGPASTDGPGRRDWAGRQLLPPQLRTNITIHAAWETTGSVDQVRKSGNVALRAPSLRPASWPPSLHLPPDPVPLFHSLIGISEPLPDTIT